MCRSISISHDILNDMPLINERRKYFSKPKPYEHIFNKRHTLYHGTPESLLFIKRETLGNSSILGTFYVIKWSEFGVFIYYFDSHIILKKLV